MNTCEKRMYNLVKLVYLVYFYVTRVNNVKSGSSLKTVSDVK